ncbi:MAG TPA: YCF48-related protein [bacterium]|jgi:photosystem II stability/assembly factor-like uncharacterized protein
MRILKALAVVVLALMFVPRLGAQTWQWQNPQPNGNAVNHVAFADSLTGWAVGGFGMILKTTDGGVTWTEQTVNSRARFESVACVGSQHVWAAGYNWQTRRGTMARSTDGGQTWTLQYGWQNLWFQQVLFTDTANGWAAGDGKIYHTANGGQTWQAQFTNNNYGLYGLTALDAQTAWAVGYDYMSYAAVILHTTDGGANWQHQFSNSLGHLWDVSFVNADTGWVVGVDRNILNTTDGGQTWTEWVSETVSPHNVQFLSAQTGFIACYDGIVLHTANAGASWDTLRFSTSAYPRDIYFDSEQRGWICGTGSAIYRTTDGGQNWSARGSGTGAFLNGVCFTDTSNGWASGSLGTMLHTTNGGAQWAPQNTGSTRHFFADVQFVNSQEGWACGTTIIHTTDGGSTWITQDSTLESGLERLAFADARHGWAVGFGGSILHTTDGGQTWTPQSSPRSTDFYDIACTDSLHAWAVTHDDSDPYNGYVIATTDGGVNWVIRATLQYGYVFSITMQDSLHGFIAGASLLNGSAMIATTLDGGATWIPSSNNFGAIFLSIRASGQTVVAASTWGLIMRSSDGGQNWGVDTTVTDNQLWALALAGPDHAWAVGEGGSILRCASAPAAADPVTPLPAAFSVCAYPNPFNPISTLELTLPRTTRVRVSLYDIQGRLVTLLTDRLFAAGTQRITVDGRALASGLYFARIESGDFVRTQRLMLLK